MVSPEGVCKKFYFDLRTDSFIQNVINSIKNRHIHMHVPVLFLYTFRSEIPLCNHFHLYLSTLYTISLSYHSTECTVS